MKTIHLTTTLHHFLRRHHALCMAEVILQMQNRPEVNAEPFQVWKFVRLLNSVFQIKLEDGNLNTILVDHKHWDNTDLKECELWFENGVLYFPHER